MSEWTFISNNPAEEFAKLHFFAMKKQQPDGEFEFRITVREYATPPRQGMKFFAETDKQTNQRTAPFTPCGWGSTLTDAVARCVESIYRFPYEPDAPE